MQLLKIRLKKINKEKYQEPAPNRKTLSFLCWKRKQATPSAMACSGLDVGISAHYHVSPFEFFPKGPGLYDVEKQHVMTLAASLVGVAGSPPMPHAATSPLSEEPLTCSFELAHLYWFAMCFKSSHSRKKITWMENSM